LLLLKINLPSLIFASSSSQYFYTYFRFKIFLFQKNFIFVHAKKINLIWSILSKLFLLMLIMSNYENMCCCCFFPKLNYAFPSALQREEYRQLVWFGFRGKKIRRCWKQKCHLTWLDCGGKSPYIIEKSTLFSIFIFKFNNRKTLALKIKRFKNYPISNSLFRVYSFALHH